MSPETANEPRDLAAEIDALEERISEIESTDCGCEPADNHAWARYLAWGAGAVALFTCIAVSNVYAPPESSPIIECIKARGEWVTPGWQHGRCQFIQPSQVKP